MTDATNTADLRAALIEARDWFEGQAKAVSKGCGSSYELHDLRVQRDALDAALATPAQPLHVAATSCPHEIDKDKIVLHFDSKQPGKNALAQLAARLQAAQAQLEAVTTGESLCSVPQQSGADVKPQHRHCSLEN